VVFVVGDGAGIFTSDDVVEEDELVWEGLDDEGTEVEGDDGELASLGSLAEFLA
jgi:hypothetical protein